MQSSCSTMLLAIFGRGGQTLCVLCVISRQIFRTRQSMTPPPPITLLENPFDRSSVVAGVNAGMSQVFAVIIKAFFRGVHNFDLAGIVLQTRGNERKRFWCALSMVLQDGAAHKSVWHCKGDAGSKFCMLCRNLFSEKSGLADEDGNDMLTCNLIHENELDMATDADIFGSVRRLAARFGEEPTAMFSKREQAVGFRHQPYGLLLDPELSNIVKPASQFCHDWMHALFVSGVFNTIAFLLLESFVGAGMRDIWGMMEEYIALWRWPKRVHDSKLPSVFSKKRVVANRKANHLKCSASDGLSLIPVMAFFARSVLRPSGKCPLAIDAFLALASLVETLVAIPFEQISPDTLRSAVADLLSSCVAAGWRNKMHPKFHWLVHFPRHLEQWGQLPTCWVHERRHKMVKRYAADISNTIAYERSVLTQVPRGGGGGGGNFVSAC